MSEGLGDINYTKEEYLNLGADYQKSTENLKTEIDIIDVGEQKLETKKSLISCQIRIIMYNIFEFVETLRHSMF